VKVSNIVAFAVGTVACISLYACGGDSHTMPVVMQPPPAQPTPPAPPMTTTLAPGDILAMSQAQSETADPTVVDGAAVTVTPGDETSDPMTVNK
jgi:hypothetical protein